MEKWRDIVWDLLISVLVIFFGGWILGSVVNQVAMASPQMVSLVFCPAGSTAIYDSVFAQPNQNGSAMMCRDRNGASLPTIKDADSVVLQRKYFYRPANYLMIILVVGWVIWRRIKHKTPDSV